MACMQRHVRSDVSGGTCVSWFLRWNVGQRCECVRSSVAFDVCVRYGMDVEDARTNNVWALQTSTCQNRRKEYFLHLRVRPDESMPVFVAKVYVAVR